MPAIELFNRRTLLGGDDLQLGCLLVMSCRVVQLSAFLLPLWLRIVDEVADITTTTVVIECSNIFPVLFILYVLSSTVIIGVSFLWEARMFHVSGVGSPTQTQPRKQRMESLLEFKLLYLGILLQGVMLALGIAVVSVAKSYFQCRQNGSSSSSSSSTAGANGTDVFTTSLMGTDVITNDDDARFWEQVMAWTEDQDDDAGDTMEQIYSANHWFWIAFVLLWLSQLGEVSTIGVFLMGLFFSSSSSSSSSSPSSPSDPLHQELVEQMWTERCTKFCECLSFSTCFVFGGKHVLSSSSPSAAPNNHFYYYGDIARALTDYFESGNAALDLVPSDIVMGFVILQQTQKQRIRQAKQQVQQERWREQQEILILQQQQQQQQRSSSASSSASSLLLLQPSNSIEEPSYPHNTFGSTPSTSTRQRRRQQQQQQHSNPPLSPSSRRHSRQSFYRMQRDGLVGTTFYESTERKVLSPRMAVDCCLLAEGARFARYQLAIYTWLMYLYQYPVTALPRVLRQMGRSRQRGRAADHQQQQQEHGGGIGPNGCGRCCTSKQRREGARDDHHELSQGRGMIVEDNNNQHQSDGVDGIGIEVQYAEGNHNKYNHSNNTNGGGNYEDAGGTVVGDNWCQIHKAALMLQAGLEDDADLIYLQLRSSFSDIPYCILVDHAWQSVVLAIRGTFSLEDCVTDVLVEPESLEALGEEFGFDGRGEYCHGGVAMCAKIVYQDLQRHGLLEKLLLGEDTAKYPDYTLRIVGHSLGAGTATLLSYMLKSKFPTLRCLNYSPPGCSMTWKLATECHDWCTAFVLDSDLVPRLSFFSMEHLRDEILELIGRVKVNKGEVMKSFVKGGGLMSCRDGSLDDDERLEEALEHVLSSPEDPPESASTTASPYQRQLESFRQAQSERRSQRGLIRSTKLYPPGRMVHFMKTGETRTCLHGCLKCLTCCTTNVGADYSPVYVKNDDLNEIVVSPTMGTDHFPNRFAAVLEKMAESYGLDTSFMPDSPDLEHGHL